MNSGLGKYCREFNSLWKTLESQNAQPPWHHRVTLAYLVVSEARWRWPCPSPVKCGSSESLEVAAVWLATRVCPRMVTQGLHVPYYSTFQNPLYQSSYVMPNTPIFRMSRPHITAQLFSYVTNAGNISKPSTTLTATSIENSRSIFSDMSRAMPVTQPSQTVGSLATIRQQMDESHHDLVNMLTHQMITVLNPILENTNTRIEQLNKQVNRIANVVDLEENNANNHGLGVENVNYNGGSVPNYDIHIPRHGQNTDEMLERLRQNNLGGIIS
ncbi:hypothetical protein PIB30_048060 [Stylosanthes scabra]|uniref:Uncharacterized protein n=1 Tax=Stylosanthes scabra TaxID=79078 RepID=A0ABU6SHP6_9FABA|nr:hypothetical protein [Stylosanthes scabra]